MTAPEDDPVYGLAPTVERLDRVAAELAKALDAWQARDREDLLACRRVGINALAASRNFAAYLGDFDSLIQSMRGRGKL